MSSGGVDIKKMFSQGGSDGIVMNHNLKSDQYKEEINQNFQVILNKFKSEINKEPDDTITKDEIMTFLDNCLPVIT